MTTVIESPARRANLIKPISGLCASDWLGLNCGDRVRERDGRHIGRVEAIFHNTTIRVRWLDTGWFSDIPLNELEKVT